MVRNATAVPSTPDGSDGCCSLTEVGLRVASARTVSLPPVLHSALLRALFAIVPPQKRTIRCARVRVRMRIMLPPSRPVPPVRVANLLVFQRTYRMRMMMKLRASGGYQTRQHGRWWKSFSQRAVLPGRSIISRTCGIN